MHCILTVYAKMLYPITQIWCTIKDGTVRAAEDYKPRKYVEKGSFVKIL